MTAGIDGRWRWNSALMMRTTSSSSGRARNSGRDHVGDQRDEHLDRQRRQQRERLESVGRQDLVGGDRDDHADHAAQDDTPLLPRERP